MKFTLDFLQNGASYQMLIKVKVKVKVKLSSLGLTKHCTMKTYWGVEI
jgi:hypothetical protein